MKIPNEQEQTNAMGLHASFYQINLFILFIWRAVNNEYKFKLGTAIKEAQQFNNIAFSNEINNQIVYRFLNAKHKANSTNTKITTDNLLTEINGDYSLTKYYFSYMKIKNNEIFKKGKIKDVIVCTNINFDFDNLKTNNITIVELKEKDDILDLQFNEKSSQRYRFEESTASLLKPILQNYNLTKLAGRLCKCFLKANCIADHDDIFKSYHCALAKYVIDIQGKKFHTKFVIGEDLTDDVSKFREAFIIAIKNQSKDQLKFENINDAIEKKLKINESVVGLTLSKKFGKSGDNEWPVSIINECDVNDFLNHLVFAVDQPNVRELDRLLEDDIGRKFDSDRDVHSTLYKKISDWFLINKPEWYSHEDIERFFDDFKNDLTICFGIQKPVESFTGRHELLENLHSELQKTRKLLITSTNDVEVGLGKTELVREYIHKKSTDYSSFIWINAENHESLSVSFRRLATEKLRIKTKNSDEKDQDIKSIVEKIYAYFSKLKVLFIFDNAKSLECIEDFLPSVPSNVETPYVLITSRNREWEDIKLINVVPFTEEEAHKYIRNVLTSDCIRLPDKEVQDLAKALQCIPLALQQATVYIREVCINGSHFDINNYLKCFSEMNKLLDHKISLTTMKLNIDKINEDKTYGTHVVEILDVMAHLDAENISTDIFLRIVSKDKTELESIVQLLRLYSIVSSGNEKGKLNIHRLAQQVLRMNLKSFDCSRKDLQQLQLLPLFKEIFLHLKKIPNDRQNLDIKFLCNLLELTSDGYFGELLKQLELLEKALPILEKINGSEHILVAKTLVELGNVYWNLGSDKSRREQINCLERALPILVDEYGSDSQHVAYALINLSNAHELLKNYDELEKALPILRKNGDQMQIANALVNLSKVSSSKKVKIYLEEALPLLEKEYGIDHSQVANALVKLGKAYAILSETENQKLVLEKALPLLEKNNGCNHIEVGYCLSDLGNAYYFLKEYEKQKKVLHRALTIFKINLGDKHQIVVTTYLNLKNAYRTDPEKAREYDEQAKNCFVP